MTRPPAPNPWTWFNHRVRRLGDRRANVLVPTGLLRAERGFGGQQAFARRVAPHARHVVVGRVEIEMVRAGL